MAELSDELGPRVAGLSTEVHAGDRILEWFGDLGYTPDTQDFTFRGRRRRQALAQHRRRQARRERHSRSSIGAHYDSVDVGRGAFDNASGVALMMQLADALRDERTPYTLVFVAFGAEEAGLERLGPLRRRDERAGPRRHRPHGQPRLRGHRRPALLLQQRGRRPGRSWRCGAWRAASASYILTSPGLNKDYPYGTTGDWSDHVAFRKAGIPYLYLEATNWLLGDKDGYQNTVKDREIWHSKKDTLSYIEQRYPGRLQSAAGRPSSPPWRSFLTEYEIPAPGAEQ